MEGQDVSYDGAVNEDGQPQGHGKCVWAEGDSYEGEWVNG